MIPDTVNSPDALKTDKDSKAFFLLRDEQLALYKTEAEAPYWKKRNTYLCAGRLSPEHKKVVFWPDPVNPGRAMHLLKEHMHIGEDWTYAVSSGGVKAPKSKKKTSVDKLNGVRKRAVEVLLDRGMVQQTSEDNSKKSDG